MYLFNLDCIFNFMINIFILCHDLCRDSYLKFIELRKKKYREQLGGIMWLAKVLVYVKKKRPKNTPKKQKQIWTVVLEK